MEPIEEKETMRAAELSAHSGPQALTTPELLQQLTDDAKNLIQMEVELAKSEARVDIESEIDLAKGVGIAAVCSLLGINMLIVSAVFALAPRYAWVAALIVGLLLLAVAGAAAYLGWQRAQKNPMGNTRETLKEDVAWAKQQIK